MAKLLYLVLDGMADSIADRKTSLEIAYKPGLDYVAEHGICGLMYPISKGVAPESDAAVISILSYDPHRYYTGRGPLEALGANMRFKEEIEVAFRANFATVDPQSLKIIDRRAGRGLRTEEAKELAKAIDGLELKYNSYAKVKATVGHRAVVIIGSESYKLSPMVDNTDPAYGRKGLISVAVKHYSPYIRQVKPLEETLEAKITAEIVNEFTRKTVEILGKHPVNIERRRRGLLPANAILLRDAGNKLPKATPLPEKFNVKFALLAEMPVELGIGRTFGAYVEEVPLPTGNPKKDYEVRLEKTLKLLRNFNIVYVHLKGPDEPGHDGNLELKKRKIEEIDKYFVRPFLKNISKEIAVMITADHATPPSAKAHTGDPVPVAIMCSSLEPDSVKKFTEKECAKGKLGVIEHGWELLPRILEIIRAKT